jgi:hypothetical protein
VIVLAIDPGTRESGFVVFDGRRVLQPGIFANALMLQAVAEGRGLKVEPDILAIEKVEAMGMAVGAEVFETVHWSGRFLQAWRDPDAVLRITRRQVKLGLCGSMRAKDANIRQALIDMLGAPGTKQRRGATYGVTSHAWAALAVAVIAVGGDALPQPFEERENSFEHPEARLLQNLPHDVSDADVPF